MMVDERDLNDGSLIYMSVNVPEGGHGIVFPVSGL